MSLLLPLGLLGLVGIGALVLIYVIKPNYQQKIVSSTYVWKLSLKRKKKRIPVSRISHILIFICQFLVLLACAFLLARPVINEKTTFARNEKVAIIDASASMLISSNEETRFERAISETKKLARTTLAAEDSAFSVILADGEAHYLFARYTAEDFSAIEESLDNAACSYGSADIEGASKLAEEIYSQNSGAEIVFFTATEYLHHGSMTVVDVSDEDDWNAAVLNCTPVLEDSNIYSFQAQVGCYGVSKSMTVYCEVKGINGTGDSVSAFKTEYFTDAEPMKTLTFESVDFDGKAIVSFDYMYVYLDEYDSMQTDNVFNVYGGTKPTVKVQYASSKPNNFFGGILRTLRQMQKSHWNIKIDEVTDGKSASEGYDFYIYEHSMPDKLPTDGVILMMNPDKAPEGSELRLGSLRQVHRESTLASGVPHAITKFIDPNRITVSEYREILSQDGYEELLYYHGSPVLLAKNEQKAKIVVFALNLNKSSLAVVVDFPILFSNIFNYYCPYTLAKNAYGIGERVTLNARGENLTVEGQGGKQEFETLPASIVVTNPGDYTVTQKNMLGDYIVEQFFVHIPNSESDITKKVDALPDLFTETVTLDVNRDLLIWIAAAALALLALEWILHAREQF